MKKYTIDHFIKKFEAIPSKNLIIGKLGPRRVSKCALGHCGVTTRLFCPDNAQPVEAQALIILFTDRVGMDVARINNDMTLSYPQNTPKKRILAALKAMKLNEKV